VKSRSTLPRAPLDRTRIVSAALDLIDRGGLDAFTTRKLGAELGVEAMAIYHHFPNKAALLDAVAEHLLLLAPVPSRGRKNWQQWMRAQARSYYGLAKMHPNAFALLAARRFNTPEALAWFERILGVFREAGFDAKHAARAFRAIGAVAGGCGMAYCASLDALTKPSIFDAEERLAPYPLVAQSAPFLQIQELDKIFEFALDAVIRGLSQAAPKMTRK
jgi:AcrR family transcriptional regulator